MSSSATIGGLNPWAFNSGGYHATSPFTVEVYDSIRSSILFSRSVVPILLSTTVNDGFVNATFSNFNLAAGNYWIGVIAPSYAVTGFSGGNGGLIDSRPHTGVEVFALGGNLGYQLLGATSTVPEPATWALMILGFGAVGGAMRRKSAVRTTVRSA